MASEIEMYRALVRQEGDALLDQLPDVRPASWSRQSPCAEWDVLDVLVHLGLGTAFQVVMVRNTLDGISRPAWDSWNLPEGTTPSEWFRQLHRETHTAGPEANIAALRTELDRYYALLDEATQDDLDRPGRFFDGDAPLRTMVAARAFDLIMHAADIRRPLRILPPFSPEGSRFIGQYVSRSLPLYWKPEIAGDAAGMIHLEVDGDEVNLVMTPDGLRFAPPDGSADASVQTSGGTWALLTWRKVSIEDAEKAGQATVAGDRALIARFLGEMQTP